VLFFKLVTWALLLISIKLILDGIRASNLFNTSSVI